MTWTFAVTALLFVSCVSARSLLEGEGEGEGEGYRSGMAQVKTQRVSALDWSSTPEANYPSDWCPPYSSIESCPLAKAMPAEYVMDDDEAVEVEVRTVYDSTRAGSTLVLSPQAVQTMSEAIDEALDKVTASKSRNMLIRYPGFNFYGSTYDELIPSRSLRYGKFCSRLYPVFSLEHAGQRFQLTDLDLAGEATLPGAMLWFRDVTVLAADTTWAQLQDRKSGAAFHSYFDIPKSTRVCFANTIFALESCSGFPSTPTRLWCCNADSCSALPAGSSEEAEIAIKGLHTEQSTLPTLSCSGTQDDPAPAGNAAITTSAAASVQNDATKSIDDGYSSGSKACTALVVLGALGAIVLFSLAIVVWLVRRKFAKDKFTASQTVKGAQSGASAMLSEASSGAMVPADALTSDAAKPVK